MAKFVKSFQEFTEKLEKDPLLQQEFKEDPVKASKNFTPYSPLDWDKWIYRIVVLSLGLIALSVVIGSIFLCTEKFELSSGIIAIGSASIGALAGLLAPSPKNS